MKKNPLHPTGWLWHNHKKKLSFLAIPKSGSNSIRKMTGCLEGPNMKRYPGYKTFSIIREPIDRYISAYIEVLIPSSDYPKGRYRQNLGLTHKLINLCDELKKIKDDIEKFQKFTDYIIEYGFFEPHTEPQTYYLNNIGNIGIYKLENLDYLLKELSIDTVLYENKTESSNIKKTIKEYIKTDLNYFNKVNDLFISDINLYESFNDKKTIK
jgi:hypothetical protein